MQSRTNKSGNNLSQYKSSNPVVSFSDNFPTLSKRLFAAELANAEPSPHIQRLKAAKRRAAFFLKGAFSSLFATIYAMEIPPFKKYSGKYVELTYLPLLYF